MEHECAQQVNRHVTHGMSRIIKAHLLRSVNVCSTFYTKVTNMKTKRNVDGTVITLWEELG